jgi:hypothetical protein
MINARIPDFFDDARGRQKKMPSLALDEIRVIISFAHVDHHQNIINACRFDEDTAKYYGAVSNLSLITKECFEISPRHSQQIIDLIPDNTWTEKSITAILKMLVNHCGHIIPNTEPRQDRRIVYDYLKIFANTSLDVWRDNFDAMWTYHGCAKKENAHLYSPRQYWRISRCISINDYVKVRKCSYDEVVYLVCMAVEKPWTVQIGQLMREYRLHESPRFVAKIMEYRYTPFIKECPLDVACMIASTYAEFDPECFSWCDLGKYGTFGIIELMRVLTSRREKGLPIDMNDVNKYIFKR